MISPTASHVGIGRDLEPKPGEDDLFGLMSEAGASDAGIGDTGGTVSDDDLQAAEPGTKRPRKAHASKVGIGVLGVLLLDALGLLGRKICEKVCCLCSKVLGSADPINADLTRAWSKPDYAGFICAYCGSPSFFLLSGGLYYRLRLLLR